LSAVLLKARLEKMRLQPKKAFGQNFLINQQVIGKIVGAVKERKFSELIEIGPGLGAITEPMLEAGLTPKLIELDPDLIDYWQSLEQTPIVAGDALKLDWEQMNLPPDSLLVSNLPYQISTSIVIDRCLGPKNLRWMILMFQKEVAQRLTALPRTKEYGMLSVMAQLHFKMLKVADASPRDFYPAPKIASRVLSFERKSVENLGVPFLKFVKRAFALRRKFLLKNLTGSVDKATLQRLGFKETVRAEELTPAQFVELFRVAKTDPAK
jgi:16S rRNA (adenine1518-N6/adenine1519-N6)-dimethyltransferase